MYYRKEKLTYNIAIPPLKKPFSKLTDDEAQEYFDWFVGVIPERMEYMRGVCAKDLGIDTSKLDFSPESLLLIGKWFYMVGKIEKTPEITLKELEKKYDGLPKYMAEHQLETAKTQPTLQTEYILRDIGMYLGEVYVRNSEHLFWEIRKKRDVDYNHPVISGFVGKKYIETIKGARICGIDMQMGENDAEKLYKFYVWDHKYIPDAKPLNYIPNWTNKEKRLEELVDGLRVFKANLVKVEHIKDKAVLYFDNKGEHTQIECTEKKAQKLVIGARYSVIAKKGVLQSLAKLKPLKRK